MRRSMLPDRPAVEALYDKVAVHGHFALQRNHDWWTQRLWSYEGDWIVYEGRRRGQIEGYLYYDIDSSGGPFKLVLNLTEFVAATPAAHRGLVGYLSSLSDQVSEIHLAGPSDNSWLQVLETPQNLRPNAEIGIYADAGGVSAGMMLRVTDVKLALDGFPVWSGARGEIALEVDDPILTQNSRTWRVRASDGRLVVRLMQARSRSGKRMPRLRVGAEVLGPLIAGTISPSRAAEMGMIEATNGGAEIAEPWFRTRPAYLYQMNGF